MWADTWFAKAGFAGMRWDVSGWKPRWGLLSGLGAGEWSGRRLVCEIGRVSGFATLGLENAVRRRKAF